MTPPVDSEDAGSSDSRPRHGEEPFPQGRLVPQSRGDSDDRNVPHGPKSDGHIRSSHLSENCILDGHSSPDDQQDSSPWRSSYPPLLKTRLRPSVSSPERSSPGTRYLSGERLRGYWKTAPVPFPSAETLSYHPQSSSRQLVSKEVDIKLDGPSRPVTTSGQCGEDTLALRRRKANRLAAQRFRSRKKGYQDSLEERVRQLEDERDALLYRSKGIAGFSSRDQLGSTVEDGNSLFAPLHTTSDLVEASQTQDVQMSCPTSTTTTDRGDSPTIDKTVRLAALESANRKLLDELRGLGEDNERLYVEVGKWRRWERDLREGQSWKSDSHDTNESVSPNTSSSTPYQQR